VPGDTSATLWTETHPYGDLPRVVDPASGWLQNANDPPWTTTFPMPLDPDDYPAYMAPAGDAVPTAWGHGGMAFRPQRSAGMLASDSSVTIDELVRYKHSTRMALADRVLDDLAEAVAEHGDERARRAVGVLEGWDRSADAGSRGAVLFRAWARTLDDRTEGRLFQTGWSADEPLATPDGLADPAAAAAALSEAAGAVEEGWGRLDPAWGETRRFRRDTVDLPANGASGQLGVFRVVGYGEPGDDGRRRATGGDSYIAAVEFGDPVRARALVGYGNASAEGSPHRADQLGSMAEQELRPVWLERADIEAHLRRRTTLGPGGGPGN
jgi:acyl-homoserine-lactone acylase